MTPAQGQKLINLQAAEIGNLRSQLLATTIQLEEALEHIQSISAVETLEEAVSA